MPTIDFQTYSEDTVKNFKPVLAKSVQPDWWKKAKVAEVVNGTIDIIKSGLFCTLKRLMKLPKVKEIR